LCARRHVELGPRNDTSYPDAPLERLPDMASVAQSLEALDSEECAVLLWRQEQFQELGFDVLNAEILAESSADLGEARRLREAGCPLDLAFRILA
jgi:hypothetical protein